jgi:hypothetical protein
MDEDILLGPDDIEKEFKEAQAAFKRESNGHLRWAGFWQNWLLHAQLRKVVEWMEKHTTQQLCVNADFSNDEPIRVMMAGSDWHALRAAAGELE